MAAVGLLDAFRVLLIGPIFDRVLNPGSQARDHAAIQDCRAASALYLQQLVPSHFHNPWTMVAFALVAATVLKGIFDYAGTYLVNYAGFGMITDLRNDLYNSILRRSAAFFHEAHHGHSAFDDRQRYRASAVRHVERAGGIPAAVFYLCFYRVGGGCAGTETGLGAVAVRSCDHVLGEKNRPASAADDRGAAGQAGRDPEHSARDDYRQPDRQGVQHGELGDGALPRGRATAVPRQSALGGCVCDQLSADGHFGRDRDCACCC